MFNQFKQKGVFEETLGLTVGHVHSLQVSRRKVAQIEEVLLRVKDYDFPILKTNDFGHVCLDTAMQVGAEA